MIKKYKQFVNESRKKIDEETFLDVVQQFYRILELHENYYYNDNKIISDPEFKKRANQFFEGLRQGNTIGRVVDSSWDSLSEDEKDEIRDKLVMTESFYNLISEYEKKYYNDDKLVPKSDDMNSVWDFIDHLVEDWDMINVNDYIFGFSEDSIYSDAQLSEEEKEEQKQKEIKAAEDAIKGLDDILMRDELEDRGISMN